MQNGAVFSVFIFANLFKIRNLKKLSLLKRDENFFQEKSSEGVLNPSYYNKPYYARKTPPSSKTVFESTSPLRAGTF